MNDDTRRLTDTAARLIAAAKKAGADAADAAVVRSLGRSVDVRLGKVEDTESSESEDLALRVFVGQRVATVSADVHADIESMSPTATIRPFIVATALACGNDGSIVMISRAV